MSLYVEDLSAEINQLHFGLFRPDGTILACVIAKIESKTEIKIRQMAVANELQKIGLGKMIMEFMEDKMKEQGYNHF